MLLTDLMLTVEFDLLGIDTVEFERLGIDTVEFAPSHISQPGSQMFLQPLMIYKMSVSGDSF